MRTFLSAGLDHSTNFIPPVPKDRCAEKFGGEIGVEEGVSVSTIKA